MGRGPGKCWPGLTIDRVEDVYRVGTDGAAGTLDDRLVVIILILDPGQQRVVETTDGKVPGQVQLHIAICPFQLAIVEVAPEGATICRQAVGLDGIALQGTVEKLDAATQLPVGIEVMFEAQLSHVVVVMQLAHALLAEERIARGGTRLVGITRQATIQRCIVAHEVAFEGNARGVIDLPAQNRSHAIAFGLDVITKGIAAFAHDVEAIGETPFVIERTGRVQRAALHALIIELAAQRDLALGQWLLGDHVEGAARIAPAVQRSGRTAQHFKALDGVGIRHVRIAAIDREAVAIELAGGKTAHRECSQPLTAEVVGPPDATRVVQSVLQSCGTDVFYRVAGHNADGLWRFMQRGIGARGAGGACGPIAFDRPLRRFGIGSALDVDILQLYGRLPGSNLVSPGGLRDRLNDAK